MPRGIPKNPRPSKPVADTTDAFIPEEGEFSEDLSMLQDEPDASKGSAEDLDGLRPTTQNNHADALMTLEGLEEKRISLKTAVQWLMGLHKIPQMGDYKPVTSKNVLDTDALDEYIDYHPDFCKDPTVAMILRKARIKVADAIANRTPEWTIEGIESED